MILHLKVMINIPKTSINDSEWNIKIIQQSDFLEIFRESKKRNDFRQRCEITILKQSFYPKTFKIDESYLFNEQL